MGGLTLVLFEVAYSHYSPVGQTDEPETTGARFDSWGGLGGGQDDNGAIQGHLNQGEIFSLTRHMI